MSVTILEALQNADCNIANANTWGMAPLSLSIAKEQLRNAITLLKKGYDISVEVEPLIEKYGGVDNVPKKE